MNIISKQDARTGINSCVMLMHMPVQIHQVPMMEVMVVVDYLQIHHQQIHLNKPVTQLTSLIIGFNVLGEIMDK